jgi:hypothetical protein
VVIDDQLLPSMLAGTLEELALGSSRGQQIWQPVSRSGPALLEVRDRSGVGAGGPMAKGSPLGTRSIPSPERASNRSKSGEGVLLQTSDYSYRTCRAGNGYYANYLNLDKRNARSLVHIRPIYEAGATT